MSGYVPNNRHIRKAPEPEPYNGNFDQQARRPMQTPPAGAPQRMVGMRFIWDNGELLPPNIPYLLTADQGSPIRGGLDARGSFIQQLQANHYEAQLLADVDIDAAVASARSEMQAALDEILTAERAEAERLRKEQEGRNVVVNYFHVRFAFGKGFFLGAWGLVKSLKEMSDLVNPFNSAWNMLASAWKAKATPQEGWYANFLNNYSAAQHEELVEALGFDPASITREKIAEAYETACFIYDDGPSKDILASFAVDYAKAQNIEEVAEFGGGAVFELVLAALLVIFTGGAGLAARGASSIRHAASLKRLGSALQRLSRTLKNAKIKLKGRGKGTGTGAQTVEVPRPKEIKAEKLDALENMADDSGLHTRGNRPKQGERSQTKEEYKKSESERRAKASVESIEGHGHARHGAQTTLNEQEARIKTGTAPDGAKAPTPRATKFDSDQAELEAVRRAEAKFEKNNSANPYPTTITTPKGTVKPNTIPIEVDGRKGGYGSGVEVIRDSSGKPLPGRPVQPTGQDPKATVIFRYDPGTGKWVKITQYPTN